MELTARSPRKNSSKKESGGAVNHVSFNLHPAAYKMTGPSYSSPKWSDKPFWIKLFLGLGIGHIVFELLVLLSQHWITLLVLGMMSGSIGFGVCHWLVGLWIGRRSA